MMLNNVGLANLITREGISAQVSEPDEDDEVDGEDEIDEYPAEEEAADLKKTSLNPSDSSSSIPTSQNEAS